MKEARNGIQTFGWNLESIKWWKWFRSPLKGLLLSNILRMKSLHKSNIGIRNNIIIFSPLNISGLFLWIEINKNPMILLKIEAPLLPKKILSFKFRYSIKNTITIKHNLNTMLNLDVYERD